MSDVVWLVGIPAVLLGITLWQPSLVTAVPTFIGIYITFIVGLFAAPLSTVAIVWLAFSVAVVPFLFYKFPGQYNLARSLTALIAWPVLAAICAIAERQIIRTVAPEDVPDRFEATVSYIDAVGTEEDYLMVFLDEFHDTVFFCADELAANCDLREDACFEFKVEFREVSGLADKVLWIDSAVPQSNPAAT